MASSLQVVAEDVAISLAFIPLTSDTMNRESRGDVTAFHMQKLQLSYKVQNKTPRRTKLFFAEHLEFRQRKLM